MEAGQNHKNEQVGLPAIDQMSEELIASLNDSLGENGILRLSDLGPYPDRDPIEQFGRAFHAEGIPLHVWQCFLSCAPFSHEHVETLDTFARAFLDLAAVNKDAALFDTLPELCRYASEAGVNVLDYIDALGQEVSTPGRNKIEPVDTAILLLGTQISKSPVIEYNEAFALRTLRETKELAELIPEIMSLVFNPTQQPKRLTFKAIVDAFTCPTIPDSLRSVVQAEIVERIHLKEELGSFCLAVTGVISAFEKRTGHTAQYSMTKAIPHYRANGWDVTGLLNSIQDLCTKDSVGRNKVVWTEHVKLVGRAVSLGTQVPLLRPFFIEQQSALSDNDIREFGRAYGLSRLSTVAKGELSWADREIRISRVLENELYLRGSFENVPELERNVVAIEKHGSLQYQAIEATMRTAALAMMLRPLGVKESDRQEHLQKALKKFLWPPGTARSRDRRPLEIVAATNSLIELYGQQGWSMDVVLARMAGWEELVDDKLHEGFVKVVSLCVREGRRFDGFNVHSLRQISDPPSVIELRIFDIYQGLIEKCQVLELDPADRIKQEDAVFQALQCLVVFRNDVDAIDRIEKYMGETFDGNTMNPLLLESRIIQAVQREFEHTVGEYYRAQGWEPAGAIQEVNTLLRSIVETPQRLYNFNSFYGTMLSELQRGIEQYQSAGWKVEGLFARFRQLRLQSSEFRSGQMPATVKLFVKNEIPLEYLSAKLLDKCESFSEEQLQHVKNAAITLRRFDDQVTVNRRMVLADLVMDSFVSLAAMQSGDYLFEKVIEGVQECRNPNSTYLVKLKRDVRAHRAMQLLSYGARWRDLPEERQGRFKEAASVMRGFTTDHLPFAIKKDEPLPDEARVMLEQTHASFRFAFDLSYGFKSLRFPCSRIGVERAEIVDFGVDAGAKVFGLHASSIETLPGRGYMIAGLDPLKAFEADPESLDRARATFSKYYDAWSFGTGIDHLENTQYWFTRQFIAMTAPEEPQFSINGVHYTVVAVNMARKNPQAQKLLAVPTTVWTEFFEGALVPIDIYESGDFTAADLSDRNVTVETMKRACLEKGLPFFDIASGSAFYGSLVNAGVPGSAPYHSWEKARQRETKDAWGHVHKSHGLGDWAQHMNANLEEFLKPLRAGHDEVNELVTGYRNIMYCTLKYMHYWRRGLTMTDDIEDPLDDIEATEDQGELPFAPNAGRMLEYAYRWYNHLQENGERVRHEPPILFAQQELSLGRLPLRPLLDTADMTVYNGSNWVQLPAWGSGKGEEELEIFRNTVLANIEPGEGLCFLDREFAASYL